MVAEAGGGGDKARHGSCSAQLDITNSPVVLSRIIPSWLFEASAAPSPVLDNDAKRYESGLDTSSEDWAAKPILNTRLKDCKTLLDIKSLVQDLDINLRGAPELCGHVLDHMLKAGVCDQDVATFICDPNFNPPGTHHQKTVMLHHQMRPVPQKSWKALRNALVKAAELGVVAVEDFPDVIRLLWKVQIQTEDGRCYPAKPSGIQGDILELLKAIDRSAVVKIEDLGPPFLSELFSTVAPYRWPISRKLLWRLSPWASPDHASTVGQLIVCWLRGIPREVTADDAGQQLAKLLISIPLEVLSPTVLQATARLVAITQENPRLGYLFGNWSQALSLLNRGGTTRVQITRDECARFLQDRSTGLTPERRLLTLMWTAMSVCHSIKQSTSILKDLQIREHVSQVFSGESEHDTRDILGRVVLTMQTLPLPHKRLLLQNITIVTDRPIKVFRHYQYFQANMDSLTNRDFAKLEDSNFYHHVKHTYHDALVELAESINDDIHLFKRLSRAMISKNKTTFKIICRILKHNQTLKFALSQYFLRYNRSRHRLERPTPGSKAADGDVDRTIQDSETTATPGRGRPHGGPREVPFLDPVEAVDLINHLAMSFSLSEVISARSALRKVYWCYIFLHRYGGPIQPAITRALWHAGVTRYEPYLPPAALLKWILQQVKAVEGDAMARKLLLSASFREERKKEIEWLNSIEVEGFVGAPPPTALFGSDKRLLEDDDWDRGDGIRVLVDHVAEP